MDLTGTGPHVICVCGSRCFRILATWSDDGEVAGYDSVMFCGECDARLEAPMPGVNC